VLQNKLQLHGIQPFCIQIGGVLDFLLFIIVCFVLLSPELDPDVSSFVFFALAADEVLLNRYFSLTCSDRIAQ
jgi:hypothetical protein